MTNEKCEHSWIYGRLHLSGNLFCVNPFDKPDTHAKCETCGETRELSDFYAPTSVLEAQAKHIAELEQSERDLLTSYEREREHVNEVNHLCVLKDRRIRELEAQIAAQSRNAKRSHEQDWDDGHEWGREEGAAIERAAIVRWLRSLTPDRESIYDGIADVVEEGEHLKGGGE